MKLYQKFKKMIEAFKNLEYFVKVDIHTEFYYFQIAAQLKKNKFLTNYFFKSLSFYFSDFLTKKMFFLSHAKEFWCQKSKL